jgi:hypothetical protein
VVLGKEGGIRKNQEFSGKTRNFQANNTSNLGNDI